MCGKESHLTVNCTWPKQQKLVAKYVGYATPGLGCLLIQINHVERVNPMALVIVKSG